MTDRELLEQALEVLEQHVEHYDYEQFTSVCELDPAKDIIAALRERLAQPEQEPVAWEFAGALFHDRDEVFSWYKRGDVSNIPPLPLYTAPPQRKPLTEEEIERACVPLGAAMLSFTEVARAIEAAHGIKEYDMTTHLTKIWWDLHKDELVKQEIPEAEIYKREWQGLTRDEVLDIEETHPLAFYRAIEAKLKEKNA